MLYSTKNREKLENLSKLASLSKQIDELGLQGKLGKQNIFENIKKLYEPLPDIIKITSEYITETMMSTSK